MLDVIGKRRYGYAFSLVLTVVGLVFILLTLLPNAGLGLQFSIAYTGGTVWEVHFADGAPDPSAHRSSWGAPVALGRTALPVVPGKPATRCIADASPLAAPANRCSSLRGVASRPVRSRSRLVSRSVFLLARPEGVAPKTRSFGPGWRALPGTGDTFANV